MARVRATLLWCLRDRGRRLWRRTAPLAGLSAFCLLALGGMGALLGELGRPAKAALPPEELSIAEQAQQQAQRSEARAYTACRDYYWQGGCTGAGPRQQTVVQWRGTLHPQQPEFVDPGYPSAPEIDTSWSAEAGSRTEIEPSGLSCVYYKQVQVPDVRWVRPLDL